MITTDLCQETYFSLSANKARSILTVLGIIIGIGSVISMVAIGQGAAKDIQTNIQALGSNLLVVMPGSQRGVGSMVSSGRGSATTLTIEDSKAIQTQVENIIAIAPTVSLREQIKTTKGTNTNTNIYGIDQSYPQIKNIKLQSGADITVQHINNLSKVTVLGPVASEDLFGRDADPIGQKIRIGNLEFTVIGLTTSVGGTGLNNADNLIYIPISTAQKYFSGNNAVNNINIQVSEEKLMTTVQAQASNLLLQRHKIADTANADFSIINQADIMNTMTSVTGTMTMLLATIAGISLLVGGIGIMNMMLTIVTERTKEIGLRKSLGARRRDISSQFLSEAVALTFIGGLLGVLFGIIASSLITKYGGTTTAVLPSSIILAVVVSATIGLIFGYYPAYRAAKLNPIDALRYE